MDNNLGENLLGDGPREADNVPFVKLKVRQDFLNKWHSAVDSVFLLPQTMTPDTFKKFEAYWDEQVRSAARMDKTKMFQKTTATGPIIITDKAKQDRLWQKNMDRVIDETTKLRAHFQGILDSGMNIKITRGLGDAEMVFSRRAGRGGAQKQSPLAKLLVSYNTNKREYNRVVDELAQFDEDIGMSGGDDELYDLLLQNKTISENHLKKLKSTMEEQEKVLERYYEVGTTSKGSGACPGVRVSEERVKELLDEFLKTHKGKTSVTAMKKWVAKKMKDEDCGCGCKGGKALTGGVLKDCPEGYRNDGLTCLEKCKDGETDDGLFCRDSRCPPGFYNTGLTCQKDPKTIVDPCPPGYRDDGITCFKDLSCRTYQDGCANRGLFGECLWGVKTDCDGPSMLTAAQRNYRFENAETRAHPTRGKQIVGRVDWQATQKQLEKGFEDAFGQDGALAKAFDPKKNGVEAAFQKFGADTEAAFKDIGEKMRKAFDPANMRRAFEEFGKMLESTLGNADWWKDTLGNPDTWITILGVIASVAATVLSAGTLGPAAFIALNMVGPATKMIGDAAQGRPVDGLDFLAIAFAMIPGAGAGASAASNAASKAIIEGVKLGATAAKVLPYAQKAVTLGKIVVSGVKVAQAIGAVPSTCLANCPDLTPEKLDQAGVAEELAKLNDVNFNWDDDEDDDDWGIAGMEDVEEDPEAEPEPEVSQEELNRQLEEIREPLNTEVIEDEVASEEREIVALREKFDNRSITLDEERRLNELINKMDERQFLKSSGAGKRNRRKK